MKLLPNLVLLFAVIAFSSCTTISESIDIPANSEVKSSKRTISGRITVESGATVRHLDTISGSITLAENVTAKSVETISGSIDVGSSSTVTEGIKTVSGSITLGENTLIQEVVRTISGSVEAEQATIEGDIKIHAGRVTLTQTQVNSIYARTDESDNSTVWVDVGPGCIVETVEAKYSDKIELRIHESAKVASIINAEAEYYQ